MKRIISSILIICTLLLCLTSCGAVISWPRHYPKGYTGGFGIHPASSIQYYWVETYEEVEAAVELLSSHGSTFNETSFINYEGDLFDTKYCFTFIGDKDSIKYGEDPFDRWAEEVLIKTYAFFEEVSIEEIEYSYLSSYDVLYIEPRNGNETNNSICTVSPDDVTCYWFSDRCGAEVYSDESYYFYVERKRFNKETREYEGTEISDECMNAILNSVCIIEDVD